MQRMRAAGLLILLGAWALPHGAAAQSPRNDVMAKLERARSANPNSVAANRALGIALYKAGRYADARPLLEQARTLDPHDGVSALYAGLAAEQVKDYTAAKAAYNSYLAVGKTRSVRNDVRTRLIAVSRAEMKAAAKDAVANETKIAQQPGSPRTIAVLPLKFSGTDATLQALERGLADLIITDLSKSKAVTVVERDRIQAIADEIALSNSSQADASTSVRAGRLIQAGRIVQGAIVQTGGHNIDLNASVLNTSTSGEEGKAAQAGGDLDQLFVMEKKLVYGVFDALGVTLTPAERQAVGQQPTTSFQAFLAYSRGLVAEDAGRFDEAARFFDNARSIDPGFGAALQRAQSASAASAQVGSTTKIESNLRASSEGASVAAAERGTISTTANVGITLNNVIGDVNPTTTNTIATSTSTTVAPPQQRDATAEKTGTDQPAPRTGQVVIIIRKP